MRRPRPALRRRVPAFAAAAFIAVLTACGAVRRPDGGQGLLPPASVAPDIRAEDAGGHGVQLHAQRGQRKAVVYFYPADGTPGCTREACAFRDAWTRLEAAGVVVIGVSSDSARSHARFLAEHHLPFALAADEDGAIGRAYGVARKLWGYDRVTFLVGRDGRVARVFPDVDPAVHADEVLRAAALAP